MCCAYAHTAMKIIIYTAMIYGQMQISESHAEATAEAVTHTQCWCKCVNDDTN